MASLLVPSSFLLFIVVAATIVVSQGQIDSNQPTYDLDLNSAKSSDEYAFNLIHNRRLKRDADDNDSKFKKVSTKKPTEVFKPKPSSTPFKPLRAGASAEVDDAHPPASSSLTGDLTPHALSAAPQFGPTETSFIPPEDATLPPNANKTEDNQHIYYNSTIIDKPEAVVSLWIDSNDEIAIPHEMLSNSHRRAATITLKFPFPFYGHSIKNVTVATGGFLYLGDTVHSWLAATQYIAPLMANFDTSISNGSSVKYVSNETHFIVQWRSVELHDSTPPGDFSFQVTLKSNGDIIFVYKHIPFPISKIPDSKHPVKVGISDAYVIDRTVFFIRRKTIYEYHRAELNKESIGNDTAIYFTALPTCVSLTSCDACYSSKLQFDCGWCAAVNRCSDGFDRYRQEWLTNKCDLIDAKHKENPDRCKVPPATSTSSPSIVIPSSIPSAKSKTDSGDSSGQSSYDYKHSAHSAAEDDAHGGRAGVVSFMIFFGLIAGIGLWVFYAYKNPQTSSGQFLIRYRPAEWRWNSNGDTRYTAASIHM